MERSVDGHSDVVDGKLVLDPYSHFPGVIYGLSVVNATVELVARS